MATTQRDSNTDVGPVVAAFDALRSSPANLVVTLGLVLFVTGALVLRIGVWAAILGIWGIALILLGVSIHAAIWWIRR